jgi:hypothetical protein
MDDLPDHDDPVSTHCGRALCQPRQGVIAVVLQQLAARRVVSGDTTEAPVTIIPGRVRARTS